MRTPVRNAREESPEGIARLLAVDSIVTRALERYLYQILEFVYDDMVAPRDKRIAELEAKLTEQRP